MNYSSASEKLANTTCSTMSYEELYELYNSLKSQYEMISKQYESSQQEIHDIKRQHQFSSELKEHLTSEVDVLQKNEVRLKSDYLSKVQLLQEEIEQLQNEKWKEAENFTNTKELLENQISKLKESELVSPLEKSIQQLDNTRITDDIRRYEEEIDFLKCTIADFKKETMEKEELNSIQKIEIESLKEQVECLKCNLSTKKDELISVTEMLHSAQDDLGVANAELQMAKNQANVHAVKGNSLFAEVDDKRQEMLKTLSLYKEKVCQSNRELVSKQAEIDSLLCEKKAMWEEYAGQADHHDALLNRGYERRITDLEKQMDQLNKEISHWYTENLDPASSDAAQWLAGVMEYYREENLRLSSDLAARSIDNLSKEQKLRDIQRQLLTWRTKAMEANAAVSQLETKLQLAEKLSTTYCNANDTMKTITNDYEPKLSDYLNETTLKNMEGFREIDRSVINNTTFSKKLNESVKTKTNNSVSRTLVTSTEEVKNVKKTSFQ